MDGRTEKRPGPALDAVVYLSGHAHGAGGIMHAAYGDYTGRGM